MTDTLRWLIAAEIIGLAAFPIAYALFPALRDRGWGFAKPLGLVLFSFLVWILSYLGILSNSGGSYWTVVAVAGALGAGYLYSKRRDVAGLVRREWPVLLAGELLFLGFFLAWVAYRAYDPSIAGTEKPMDLLFLNASAGAEQAPPTDPWLSGQPVAYYYFGYWMMGGLSQMAAVPTFVAFNLSIALIAGLSAGAIFTLVHGLVRADGGRRSAALISGGAAAVLLLVAANLIGFWEVASVYNVGSERVFDWVAIDGLHPGQSGDVWRPDSFWWWWRGSRVINTFDASGAGLDFTIQEFPFFSLLLGDLHPHLMSIPFVLLAIGMILTLFLSPARWGLGWIRRNSGRALALSLVIGALGFINAWDLATLSVLLARVATIKVYRAVPGNLFAAALRAAPAVAVIVGIGLAAYSPFYFGTFSSQVDVTEPIGAAGHSTRLIHFLTVWGLALMLIAPFLVAVLARPVRRSLSRLRPRIARGHPTGDLTGTARPTSYSPLLIAGVLVLVPYILWAGVHLAFNDGAQVSDLAGRFASVLPLAIASVLSMLVLLYRARRGAADGGLFALVLIALSLYLLYGVELIYVNDLFGNRMNTVFKTYYQVWIFLAAAGAYGLHYWGSRHVRWTPRVKALSRTAAGLVAVLVVGALYYPIAASFSKTEDFSAPPTLDGLAYISRTRPAERDAISYLAENARTDDTVLEAVGGSYTEFGRISASTGVPTVLGWQGHEHQWRGTTEAFEGRDLDVETVYRTTDAGEASRLLQKYGVTYVVVGPRERSRYAPLEVEKFGRIGELVFDRGDTQIFLVRE